MATFKELFPVLASAAEQVQPGCGFTCDNENEQALRNLLAWASGHPSFFGDLGKGIMLMGSFGTGKTLMLRALQRCLHGDPLYFTIHTTRDVVTAYNLNGSAGLRSFTQARHMMFDDLGAERMGQHYGDRIEVMQQIIEDRYELFLKDRAMTHLTTNLEGPAILERYRHRMYSRLRHMHNTWPVGPEDNATDRREKAKAPPRVITEPVIDAPSASPEVWREGIAKAYAVIAEVRSTMQVVPKGSTNPQAIEQAQWEAAIHRKITGMGEGALIELRRQIELSNTPLAAAPILRIIDAQLIQVRADKEAKSKAKRG